MNYTAKRDTFTQINEPSGTLQNVSKFLSVEVSNTTDKGSGFLVSPLSSITFDTSPLYVRCADGRSAEVRCVPFKVKGNGGSGGGGTATINAATDEDIAEMLDNNFGLEE